MTMSNLSQPQPISVNKIRCHKKSLRSVLVLQIFQSYIKGNDEKKATEQYLIQ